MIGPPLTNRRLLDDLFLSYGQHQDSPLKEKRNGESKGVTIRRSSARERRDGSTGYR